MGVLRYKILRDLWGNKGRTLQVVLIIGFGAASLGMIMSTRNLIVQGMENIWKSANAAAINLFVYPPVNTEELFVLKRTDGVKDIEGLSTATIEWRLNPNDDWQSGGLTAREDYQNQRFNKLELVEGEWPEGKIVANGQDNVTFFKIPPQGQIYIKVNNRIHKIQLGGVVYNQLVQPAYFGGTAQFYSTAEYFEILVGDRDFGQLLVAVNQYEEEATTKLANQLQAKLEKQGKDSARLIVDPNKHFFQDQIDGILIILGALSLFALVLGLLLVYNTINAVITQQVDQIGIMKAIGANFWQILRLYLTTIIVFGLLSLLFSLPIGIFGGWMIAKWLIGSFGAEAGGFQISTPAIIVQIIVAFLAPLIASFIPIVAAARTTVRDAISTYGLSSGISFFEKLLGRLKNISRLILLTISNTFRHKRRVLLLEVSLVISGLMFMMVVSVRDSVSFSINDVIFAIYNSDITMVFDRPQRINNLEALTLRYPGVKAVEMWGVSNLTLRPINQAASDDDESATLLGVPLPTQLYGAHLLAGRWLDPKDDYAIVLNKKLADDVGVGVGDWITLRYAEKNEKNFRVVGLIFDPLINNSASVPREVMLRDLVETGRAVSVWIQTESQDPQTQMQMAKDLRAYYENNNIDVSATRGIIGMGDSTVETAGKIVAQFNFIIVLLGIMSIVIAAVGSIALSGALSLSVIERRREIGVMRAIGAPSWTIARLFIGEGLILGWLSWLFSLPLSVPAGQGMVNMLGDALGLDLIYNYTPTGAITWFFIVTILSILASFLPALGATRISVRESLAYQ